MEHGTRTGPEAVEVIDTTAREDKPVLWRSWRWWSLVKPG